MPDEAASSSSPSDMERQRLKLAVSESLRRRLDQYAQHIQVVDGTEKGELRQWLEGVEHARHSAKPGDSLLLDMIGPLVKGGLALFVRTTLERLRKESTDQLWERLKQEIKSQYLGRGEARYWKDKVERIKQEMGESVREYSTRFMYAVQQAYTPLQLEESVIVERLVTKFIKGIRSRTIRGMVTIAVSSDLEQSQESQDEGDLEDSGEGPSQEAGEGPEPSGGQSRRTPIRAPDLQKLINSAAVVAFGYETESEQEELEGEIAALPPPPPSVLHDSPALKEITGTFKSFQKDLRMFMTQQAEKSKKLQDDIAAVRAAAGSGEGGRGGLVNNIAGPPGSSPYPAVGPGGYLQLPPTHIHNHFASPSGNRGRGRGTFRAGPRAPGGMGPRGLNCWFCGELGHFQRECPSKNTFGPPNYRPNGGAGESFYNTTGAPNGYEGRVEGN